MKRNIILIILMASVLTISTGAVYAYFSAISSSVNNIFASGKMEMKISKDNSTYADSVTAAFGGTGLMPGTCLNPGTIYVKNTGSIAGNHIDITATNTNPSLAAFLKLETFTYDGASVSVQDANSNGFADLGDLQTKGANNLSLTDKNVSHTVVMKICLDTNAGNEQQDQTDTMELHVLFDQGPH